MFLRLQRLICKSYLNQELNIFLNSVSSQRLSPDFSHLESSTTSNYCTESCLLGHIKKSAQLQGKATEARDMKLDDS